MKNKGFTLIELMIVIAIIAVIAAIAIPGLLAAQRSSNERNASASLKSIATAEADFRSSDREGNLINDFWTGDVAGLCIIRPTDGSAVVAADAIANGIKLIEPSIAAADGSATIGLALYTTEQTAANRPFTTYQGKAGFAYRSAVDDQVLPVGSFRFDTDATANYGACHCMDRFAFLAYPATLSSGKLAFVLNAEGTMYKLNLAATYVSGYLPLVAGSSSAVVASGSADMNNGNYPVNPSASGYSKMD